MSKYILKNWMEGKYLTKKYNLKGYNNVMSFANKIIEEANKQKHHPELVLNYGSCVVRLLTNDSKPPQVTDKDYKLADSIDAIAKEYFNYEK